MMMFAGIDSMIKAGQILEFGYFTDGRSGYAISTGEAKDAFAGAFSFQPFIYSKPHEIVPYETAKEVERGIMKAQAEAMKQ
jgi:uncharacterized Rossmann fold enzyme